MPNNRSNTEIDQRAFLSFAFKGQKPPVSGKKLTALQQVVFDVQRRAGPTLLVSSAVKEMVVDAPLTEEDTPSSPAPPPQGAT